MMQDVQWNIKSRIVIAKAAFNNTTTIFTRKLDLNLRKRLVNCYICGWGNLDTSKNRSEIPYVVEVLRIVKEDSSILRTIQWRKALVTFVTSCFGSDF